MEALYENPFQQHKDDHENLQQDQDLSTVEDEGILHLDSQHELHEMNKLYEENLYTASLEINEENHYLSKRKQKVLSPLSENEIDQLLNGQVTTQVNANLQCAHGQEGDGRTSSSSENGDSLVSNFIDQHVEDFHMAESDERESVVSDLSIKEDSMQRSQVSNSKCDNVKTTISDVNSDCDDQENLVLSPIKENSVVEIIQDEEDRVLDPSVLMSLEHSLHEEVIQLAHEQQDEIFSQASERVPLDEFIVDDRNVSVRFQEISEVSFLMIDEYDEYNENLAVISYEDDLPYIQTSEDQTFRDSLSDSSSYVSCFEVFFEEEICSSTFSKFLRTRNILLLKYSVKKDQYQRRKTPCSFSRRKVFMLFMIHWQMCCSQQ